MRQLFTYHPTIGHCFVPGLKARVAHESGGYYVRANDLGFRSEREFVPERRTGMQRLLLFGDSFTCGDGVSNQQRYSDRLEAAISDLEVYNFGMSATGTDQHYLICREFCREIDHDLVVIAVFLDNVRRVTSRYRPHIDEGDAIVVFNKPYFELEEGRLVPRHQPVPRVPADQTELPPALIEVFRQAKHRGRSVADDHPLPEYDDPHNSAWCVMRAILEQWIGEHPRPVVLMPIPLHQFVEHDGREPTSYLARFREVSAVTGCVLHDPLPDLRAYPIDERRSFRYGRDIHLTPRGHAALADSLVPVVRRVLGRTMAAV
jgi:hypothetical protein